MKQTGETKQIEVGSPILRKIPETFKMAGWLIGSWIRTGAASGALIVLFWQAWVWLQAGHWVSVATTDVILFFMHGTAFGAWLVQPQSWYGLQKIVRFLVDLPLWAWMLGIFFVLDQIGVKEKASTGISRSSTGRF